MTVPADHYAVMGNPIAHSKSPLIHTLFAEQTGQSLRYETMLVEREEFPEAVTRFFAECGSGLNITLPFKEEAWALANHLTKRAKLAGAVNTLWKDKNGMLWGDTTDGIGLVRDLVHNHQKTITGSRVLVLGAGGAVRGLLEPLLAENPKEVVIANRTVSRAENLVDIFKTHGVISACGYFDIEGSFDIVINGTSSSLHGVIPPIPSSVIDPGTVVYDMMYGDQDTIFMEWAKREGAQRVVDGLGMLIEQAAESFYIWRRVRPETEDVTKEIRHYLL